jgi:hypothetical protein
MPSSSAKASGDPRRQSIWVDHLRSGSPELAALPRSNRICIHDFVHGVRLWTKDRRLKTVAEEIGLAYAGSAH